jgi:3-hydroxybutyryl-CoA dehydrogenase
LLGKANCAASCRQEYFQRVLASLRSELQMLVRLGVLDAGQAEIALSRVSLKSKTQAAVELGNCDLVFEAVPEVIAIKQETFRWVSEHAASRTIIASTTSTFLVTEPAEMVSEPGRFVNAHWLNPAHLMPPVEVSRSETTGPEVVERMLQLLKRIGKVPVVCNPVARSIHASSRRRSSRTTCTTAATACVNARGSMTTGMSMSRPTSCSG